MRKQVIIAVTAAVIGAGALGVNVAQADRDRGEANCAEAWGGKHGAMFSQHGMRAEHRMQRLAEKLDLTQAQQDRIEDLFDQQRSDMRQQMRALRDMRQEMHRLDVTAADYDQQVEAMISKGQERAATMIRMRAEQKKALFALLTPEQQAQYLELRQ